MNIIEDNITTSYVQTYKSKNVFGFTEGQVNIFGNCCRFFTNILLESHKFYQ